MAIIYTPLAEELLQYLQQSKTSMVATSDSLNQSLALGADYFSPEASILTANFGFDGYMGVPGLNGTDSDAQAAAYQYGVSWENIDPSLGAAARAYYSAVSDTSFLSMYGTDAYLLDTIPVVFSHPVLGTSLNPTDFAITLNTGETVTPVSASFLPNVEFNERQTVVITGDWGNRLQPDDPDARYPVQVSIVDDGTPLSLVTQNGLASLVGTTIASQTPYLEGNGPRILAAKLDGYSDLGEGAPIWLTASTANSGSDLYQDQAQFRLRVYTSAGFSPDGIASIMPDDFAKYFYLDARDDQGELVEIRQAGVDYEIGSFGSLKVLGIADTGPAQDSYDLSYVEDHDNQYDIILSGDAAAIARLVNIHMPSGDGYSPVYNPGGPGNDPESNPPVPFTVPSSAQTVAITHDQNSAGFVSFIEVDGSVARDPMTGQPIGSYRGLAVSDTSTGHEIYKYLDPDEKVFYASFEVSPIYRINLTEEAPDNYSRVTDDFFTGSAGLNHVYYSGQLDQYEYDGDLGLFNVYDTVPFRDAIDRLYNVERLMFSDSALALDVTGNAGLAFSLYGMFGRVPATDGSGLGYWINELDNGASSTDVARGFMASEEFQRNYGLNPDNREFLTGLYDNYFGRTPDAAGYDYWLSELVTGQSSQAQVAVSFAISAEYQSLVQPIMNDHIEYQPWIVG